MRTITEVRQGAPLSMTFSVDDGSVVLSDGMVIVKLAQKYRPKQAYEIAYENRR